MFLAGDGVTVMVAEVVAGTSFKAGAPRELFKLRPDNLGVDFTPDGERILVPAPVGEPQAASVTIDVNWTALLNR
jgi:hypothetical protein